MSKHDELNIRIADLEVELKRRDEKIGELKEERTEALQLVDQMREHLKGASELLDSWKYSFNMTQNESGLWVFNRDELWEAYAALLDRYEKLVGEWNKFTREYNSVIAPRDQGRPLAASEAQVKDVLKRRKAGASLRGIAMATNLSLSTVRTIVDKDRGTDRTSKRRNELRKREFDRLRAADYRARKRARDQLPKTITAIGKRAAELEKAAKGIG